MFASQINSNGAGGGDINVTAYSPTNRPLLCPVKEEDGVYAATFQPDEAGQWSIAVRYDEEHIQGSPFTCHVYDPHAIRVSNRLTHYKYTPGSFTLVMSLIYRSVSHCLINNFDSFIIFPKGEKDMLLSVQAVWSLIFILFLYV